MGRCPDENLITTVGYLAYMDDKSIILGRGIENHCDEDLGIGGVLIMRRNVNK